MKQATQSLSFRLFLPNLSLGNFKILKSNKVSIIWMNSSQKDKDK